MNIQMGCGHHSTLNLEFLAPSLVFVLYLVQKYEVLPPEKYRFV